MPQRHAALPFSPIGWGLPRRLMVVALAVAGLWAAVGWAMEWWQ
ncbi:hypothetical protein [Telmatospirillum sp.]|nr:hypothetical protein [Telmatospirillum sp.]MDR3437768.1 hypothetical protein [Telmatospirillum sp.]